MTDVVVTVPMSFGLETWIAEGDAAGEPWSGQEWHYYFHSPRPRIEPGERVYVVYAGRIRGYAPLVRLENYGGHHGNYRQAFVRHGGAVACSIPDRVRGFRGWRYRWWEREIEVPFPDWRIARAIPIGATE